MKKILVLLAAYNSATWIKEQVHSILEQRDVELDIVINIDSSSDDTERICSCFEKKYENICVLKHETKIIFGGAAKNFFYLIENCDFDSYDFIAFSDHDDIWDLDKMSKAINILSSSGFSGYSSNVTAFWLGNNKRVLIEKSQPQKKWDYLFESAGPGCTFVIKKCLADKIKDFIINNKDFMSLVWLHDWFIYAYCRSFQYKWHIDSGSTMLYRQHDTNQVGVNSGLPAFIHRVKFVFSGQALKQSLLFSRINPSSNSFFSDETSISRIELLNLAFNSNNCRRRLRDKVFFFFSCIFLSVLGHKSK